MDKFKSFIYFLLSIQKKLLEKRLEKTLGVKNSSKRKKYYTEGCMLNLDSLAEVERVKLEEEIELILKSAKYDTEAILKYIIAHGTNVFYIDNEKQLNSIGENAGFIYPQSGAKALALSLLTKQGIKFKFDESFVLTRGELNVYYFIYHFYNWYVFKKGIAGIDAKSQELLNKYLFEGSNEDISKLQLAEIYQLKDAIKQDKFAIEFVFKLCQKYEGGKKALEKLKNDGASI